MQLQALLRQLADFDTPLLANTIGKIDPTPVDQWYLGGSIRSVTPSLGPTVGVAVLCEADTSTPEGDNDLDGLYRQIDDISRMDLPAMWVVKAVGSRPDHECILGDGMAKMLQAAGCLGIVTDGGVRDVDGLLSTPFAAYCRGVVVHHCAIRVRPTTGPLEVGGITIEAGDVLHANKEGVIKIPASCREELPRRAVAMRAFEHAAHIEARRTDITIDAKRDLIGRLAGEYGF
jgi:4-hydroxy-4-methyl-2-oxoglutarate aldolase